MKSFLQIYVVFYFAKSLNRWQYEDPTFSKEEADEQDRQAKNLGYETHRTVTIITPPTKPPKPTT